MNNRFRRPRANFPYDAMERGGSNIASVQPDETQFAKLRQHMQNGMLPFECVIELMQAKNSPPQVRQKVYTCVVSAATGPVLLIPTNSKRLGFIVSIGQDNSSTLLFSYDYPIKGTSHGHFLGIPIVGGYFIESNGLASVNDVYVFTSDTDPEDTFDLVGYEAVVTITPDNIK